METYAYIRSEFQRLVAEGHSDEQAIVRLFRSGIGLMFVIKSFAELRQLSFREAARQTIQWTSGISVISRAQRPLSTLNPGILKLLSNQPESPVSE